MSEFLGRYMKMNLTQNIFNIVFNQSDLTNINPFIEFFGHGILSLNANVFLSVNPLITYNSKLITFISFIESGIVTVADIAYKAVPGFFFASLCNCGNC